MFILENSADPDETPHYVASHLGLLCLYMFLFCIQPVPQVSTLNFRLATPLLLVLFFSLSEISSFVYISVASISDTGYWEGSVGEREGWFPSEHVQEVRLRHKGGYRLLNNAGPALDVASYTLMTAHNKGAN